MKLTQVSNTRWHETCPYQCLIADVVPLSLQYITIDVLSSRRGRRTKVVEIRRSRTVIKTATIRMAESQGCPTERFVPKSDKRGVAPTNVWHAPFQ